MVLPTPSRHISDPMDQGDAGLCVHQRYLTLSPLVFCANNHALMSCRSMATCHHVCKLVTRPRLRALIRLMDAADGRPSGEWGDQTSLVVEVVI